jgi:hypothetical protein
VLLTIDGRFMPQAKRKPDHREPSAAELSAAEALRKAISQVSAVIPSLQGIRHAASKAGYDVSISRAGLDQFMKRETKTLTPKHREPLEQFLFRSPLGRALRHPSRASSHDRLVEVLSSGAYSKPDDLEVTGSYFFLSRLLCPGGPFCSSRAGHPRR